ncbi:NAD(P)-binding protein [Xylaria scruposa]|nr:NAD(P)-binding protein [Xylaria scruposa]
MNVNGNALIIGGGGGIGRACVLAFAKYGAAAIVVADVNLDAAVQVCQDSRAHATHSHFKAEPHAVDVTSRSSVDDLATYATRLLGRIDYCVNAAGLGAETQREVADADPDEFARLLQTNVTGAFLVMKSVSAIMKTQEARLNDTDSPARGTTRGSIVVIGSASSFSSGPGLMQYTTSKFGVLGLAKNSALDNAQYGIRVNCICPSWVNTPMVKQAVDNMPGLGEKINSAVPLGRIATPEEVADAVIFMSSPLSSYVTGSGFILDGAHGYISQGFPAPGLRRTVRHITGHNEEGKATFLSTDCGDHHLIMGEQQALANILYSTHETPVEINGNVDIKHAKENPPPLHYEHGTVMRMIDFAPNEISPMHRALTIDYGVVLDGEFELILESGESKIMRQGDVCIQRATGHQWKNLTGGGTMPGRMLWFLVGVKDVYANGKKLEEYMGPLGVYYEGKSHEEVIAEVAEASKDKATEA